MTDDLQVKHALQQKIGSLTEENFKLKERITKLKAENFKLKEESTQLKSKQHLHQGGVINPKRRS